MDDFLGKLKSGADKLAFEAEKLGKQAEAKADVESLRFSLQSKYAELGKQYYKLRSSGGAADPAVEALCKEIAEMEAKVAARNEELKSISSEAYAEPAVEAATPAAKFCSSCGKEMAREAKFCPNCGASN
ncbi:MAG: zinc ribbon domain-containing protein [Anaerolineaceae bacterium]|nr:zinc ribbon domain-containing protein [Anaerolineaceae bacterium]